MHTLATDKDGRAAPSVVMFTDMFQELHHTGGKGSTLARLSQQGYPVPPGFIILPAAFEGDALRPAAWSQVQESLAHLGRGPYAVRSSALAEDSATASFAGEFESVLNVRSEDEIWEAILTVRRSRHSDRVQSYSEARGIKGDHEMAVLVQRMVAAQISGVLFTADPVTGARGRMVGNFVRGLGDKLVSGESDAQSFTYQRPRGRYQGPTSLRPYAKKLYRLAVKLEKELDSPQDIEWAVAGGRLCLLQSRPITTLIGHHPATGEWNDTRTGDFLWSNVNFGEAVTEAMSPLAWSVLQFTLDDWRFLPDFPTTGGIAYHPYLNISLFASLFFALGRSRDDLMASLEGTLYMPLPARMEIPTLPLTVRDLLAGAVGLLKGETRQRQGLRRLPAYLATNQNWFRRTRDRLRSESSGAGLLTLWRNEIAPHVLSGVWTVLGTATYSANYTMKLRRNLNDLFGLEDTDLLIASLSDDAELLPSLGPVAGLARVASGEMERERYLELYGHRGPHEFEISRPRPVEDPTWLDEQLAAFHSAPIDVDTLLEKQRALSRATLQRLSTRFPSKSKGLLRQIDESARRARLRENARSEYVRDRWMVRLFALRAGELTGLGQDIFLLTLKELLTLLDGDKTAADHVPARRETYQRCLALPPLPSIIRGRFDPFRWAADPQRRNDIYDACSLLPAAHSQKKTILRGTPGSAGQVEGRVRVLRKASEGDQFRQGEILVATQTDVSWTTLFPRAAAVITDVGAPLSHAAIVARELGLPAVVGCGDATQRLQTGDRVKVDGGRGVVELLESFS